MFPLTPSHSSLLTTDIVAAGPRPQRPGGLVEHSQVPTNNQHIFCHSTASLESKVDCFYSRVTAGYFYLKAGGAGPRPTEIFDYK